MQFQSFRTGLGKPWRRSETKRTIVFCRASNVAKRHIGSVTIDGEGWNDSFILSSCHARQTIKSAQDGNISQRWKEVLCKSACGLESSPLFRAPSSNDGGQTKSRQPLSEIGPGDSVAATVLLRPLPPIFQPLFVRLCVQIPPQLQIGFPLHFACLLLAVTQHSGHSAVSTIGIAIAGIGKCVTLTPGAVITTLAADVHHTIRSGFSTSSVRAACTRD